MKLLAIDDRGRPAPWTLPDDAAGAILHPTPLRKLVQQRARLCLALVTGVCKGEREKIDAFLRRYKLDYQTLANRYIHRGDLSSLKYIDLLYTDCLRRHRAAYSTDAANNQEYATPLTIRSGSRHLTYGRNGGRLPPTAVQAPPQDAWSLFLVRDEPFDGSQLPPLSPMFGGPAGASARALWVAPAL